MREASKNWIEFAERDLAAAKRLVKDEYVANVCLFHCQQTLEKLFKAVLEENKTRIPRIHSLTTLFEQLPAELKNKNFITSEELGLIDDIYIDARYPGDVGLIPGGFPTSKDAMEVLEITDKVHSVITGFLKNLSL